MSKVSLFYARHVTPPPPARAPVMTCSFDNVYGPGLGLDWIIIQNSKISAEIMVTVETSSGILNLALCNPLDGCHAQSTS